MKKFLLLLSLTGAVYGAQQINPDRLNGQVPVAGIPVTGQNPVIGDPVPGTGEFPSVYGNGRAQYTQPAGRFDGFFNAATQARETLLDGMDLVLDGVGAVSGAVLRYGTRIAGAGLSRAICANKSKIFKTALILIAMRKIGLLKPCWYLAKNGGFDVAIGATKLGLQAGWFVTRNGAPIVYDLVFGKSWF